MSLWCSPTRFAMLIFQSSSEFFRCHSVVLERSAPWYTATCSVSRCFRSSDSKWFCTLISKWSWFCENSQWQQPSLIIMNHIEPPYTTTIINHDSLPSFAIHNHLPRRLKDQHRRLHRGSTAPKLQRPQRGWTHRRMRRVDDPTWLETSREAVAVEDDQTDE